MPEGIVEEERTVRLGHSGEMGRVLHWKSELTSVSVFFT